MNNKKLLLLVLFLMLFSFKVSAVENCSTKGYTVVNINGIFTNEQEAILNKKKLEESLPKSFNSQPLIVDYLYNSTHLAGAGDIVDVVKQGFFNSKSDFELVEMMNDASSKIKTQKLLLVGYSQGNFYANNFYDKVTDKEGGIPNGSIGVYGVATPADRVPGNGQYLTSDTDKVISTLFSSVKNIMTPNTHIGLQDKNDYGHSFTDVYLKYRGDKIVSDIKSSLNNLASNNIQNTQNPCISPEEISLGHKINKVVLGATDFVVNNLVKAQVFAFNKIAGTVKSLASLFGGTSNKNLASAGSFNNENPIEAPNQTITNESTSVEIANNTKVPTQSIPEKATENINREDTPIVNNTENNPEISNSTPVENPIPVINNGNSSVSGGGGSSSVSGGGGNSSVSGGGGSSSVSGGGGSNSGSGGGGSTNNNTGGGSSSYNSNNVDIIAPIITLVGEDILNINLGTTYADAGATALDEKDGDIAVVTTGTVDTAILGTYSLTYTATDKSLNVATKTRTINVIKNVDADILPPVITLVGEDILNINLGTTYADAGATALDNIDGSIAVITTGIVDTATVGTYTLTYTATDKALNTSTKTRTINVVTIETVITDTTAPVITLNGENTITTYVNDVYTDAGATALDNTDGVITVVATGMVDTSVIGIYTITYTATDKALNVSILTRTVNVVNKETVVTPQVDTTAPVITILGDEIVNISLNSTYTDAGATALDDIDPTVEVITTGTVDTTTLGTYTLTYTATDKSLNVATKIRTVNVIKNEIVDIVAPIITLSGEDILNVNLGATYTDAGATALDETDGDIAVVTTGTVDTATLGSYILTYTATDKSLNVATKIRTVNVIKNETSDIIAPVITLVGESIITIPLDSTYVDAGATALDETDGELEVVTTGTVDTSNIGVYTITYTATDIANNIGTKTRTINVINTNPVVSTTATLSLPNAGTFAGDGIEPSRGRKNLTPFIFQVIYTDINNNAPKNVKLNVNNLTTGISLPEVVMNKITLGTDILSDGNYANGEIYTTSSIYDLGDYNYYFTASDINENTAKAEDNNLLRFSAINSSYTYLPKYTFGLNNGDGKDWQVWSFNGSNVYDWTDTYLDKYLREQFKIQTYPGGYWCSQCLQRGVFNHDPQKGFETSDLVTSGLEGNPQNNMTGQIYNVTIQWDSTGYSYTVSHNSIVDSTGHTDVANMNNDLWVGWDGSFNNFTGFPSGGWQGVVAYSPMERTGGGSMVLQPYPVYDSNANSVPEPIPEPTPVLSSEKLITSFNFDGLVPSVAGVVNNTDHTISLTVPYKTDVTTLIPTIIISEKSSILPTSGTASDFTNPVTYIVTAEDGSTSSYIVTVVISPNPNPEPVIDDTALPTIASYTLNGSQNNITIDPIANNLEIILNANKNVNWMSIKIEKEDNSSFYKMFQSGGSCVDGTNTCTKVWDGILSSGGLLKNGNYKIKVHMKDNKNNEYEDYLPSIITVNGQQY